MTRAPASRARARPARARRTTVAGLRLAAVAALTVAALAIAPAALAAECPKTSLAAVEAEVMCPVCGTPLGLAAEAPQANRERALIQRLVERCRSKEEIKDVLVAQYGPGVLALPEPEGFDLAAYAVPALALLAAAGGVALAARRWRGGGASGGPAGADVADAGGSPDDRRAPSKADRAAAKRLDSELERYDL